MSVIWTDIVSSIEGLAGYTANLSEASLVSWFNKAQRHFAATHTAALRTTTFTGDGSTRSFALPADYLQIYGVFQEDADGMLEPKDLRPGTEWSLEDTDTSAASSVSLVPNVPRPFGYIEWPRGYLDLFIAPASGSVVKVWYYGYWTEVVEDEEGVDSSVIEPPLWAHEALQLYTLAMSNIPNFSDASVLNEYKTKVDSGSPLHNPLIQAHDALMKRYRDALASFPRQERTMVFTQGSRN